MAIVGCEASGKTVLTAAMADFYRPSTSGRTCTMMPENLAAHKFFEYTQYQMRAKRTWPQATNPDKTTIMKWSFRIDGDVVSDLDTLDFGGEVFRAAFREGEPTAGSAVAQKELLDYLSAADFVVVTVSLEVLLRDLEVSKEISQTDFARDAEAKWVTHGLLDFVRKKLPPETGVVIALTQADRYYDELVARGGPDELFRESWPTVAGLYPDIPVVAVAAVSGVGKDGLLLADYSTEGILPMMNVFADFSVGGLDVLRTSIDRHIALLREAPEDTDPRAYRKNIDEYSDKVQLFGIASGLAGDYYAEEFQGYVNALVNGKEDIEKKLRRLEEIGLAKFKAKEAERKQAEEAARIAQEEKRKADAAAERKRREEDAKKAEDERIRAEKDFEKSKLEAEVELAKARAIVHRNRVRSLVAALALLAVSCVSGLSYFIYTSWRAGEVVSMTVRETQRAALAEKVLRLGEAARKGDLAAAQQILDMLERHEVFETEVSGLNEIYMLLVNEGDARAMFRLGVACREGTCGVKKSDFNAHWFLSLAKKNGCENPQLATLLAETASAADGGATANDGLAGHLLSEETPSPDGGKQPDKKGQQE